MNNNICSNCGTQNEPQYTYCKNCGSPLNKEQSVPSAANAGYSYSEQPPSGGFATNPNNISIGGIPTDEIALFIGKKSDKIMPKFIKMELTGSKISWCWPAAILGYLFGPIGAAFWYFYRKMNVKALILAFVGAVAAIAVAVLDSFTGTEIVNAMESALTNEDFNALYDAFLSITPLQMITIFFSSLINSVSSLLSLILCGLFGYNSYKKHCISKINEFKAVHTNSPYYRFGLTSLGGVSGGMLAVGIIIYVVVNNASSVLSALLSLI